MRNLIGAACRRTAGMAAGVILCGGIAGGVLLTPGTALADTAVATTTAITGTSPSPDAAGTTTLTVRVSVTPASGTAWPAGTVKVTDTAGDSCTVTLAQDGTSAVGAGRCDLTGLAGGFYTLTASYAGSSAFTASASDRDKVYVKHRHADVATWLNCTRKVYTGKDGTCTLSVTNSSSFAAADVTAQVSLPWQLKALHCGPFWWSHGCTISHNTATENFATLKPGQTRTLTVAFAAKTSWGLWGWHRFHSIVVKVTGSAAVNHGWYGAGPDSHSTAYVKIVPRGWWWAF
jgi:Big-like domain-containing protein